MFDFLDDAILYYSMNPEETFNLVKSYLQSEVACQEALSKLKPGVEIGVVIGDKIQSAIYYQENCVQVDARAAERPDVIFNCKPESIYLITQNKGTSVAQLGTTICKEALAGNIQISAPGSLMGLATNGYIDMIKLGGTEFLSYLAQHGFTKFSQIMMLINKIRNK